MENINKENFFNEIMVKYPQSWKVFSDWIDEYKIQVGWDKLFASNDGNIIPLHPVKSPIKFHHLPFEMQNGIIARFEQEVVLGNSALLSEIVDQHKSLYEEEIFKELENKINSKKN